MLGVHINPILDFREHFMHITKDVRKLAKALTNRKLSPTYKTLVVEQLLKSKYLATHLGVLNDRQLTTIDGILNKAICVKPLAYYQTSPQREYKELRKNWAWDSPLSGNEPLRWVWNISLPL